MVPLSSNTCGRDAAAGAEQPAAASPAVNLPGPSRPVAQPHHPQRKDRHDGRRDPWGRRIEARRIDPAILTVDDDDEPRVLPPQRSPVASVPEVMLLDLPLVRGDEAAHAPRIAAFARPWPGAVAVALGTPLSGFLPRQAIEQAAVMGELTAALPPGPLWRLDRGNQAVVRLFGGGLASIPMAAMLNGANVAAITGVRYSGLTNAVIDTAGGGASYFPGDSAGSVATGAQYA